MRNKKNRRSSARVRWPIRLRTLKDADKGVWVERTWSIAPDFGTTKHPRTENEPVLTSLERMFALGSRQSGKIMRAKERRQKRRLRNLKDRDRGGYWPQLPRSPVDWVWIDEEPSELHWEGIQPDACVSDE